MHTFRRAKTCGIPGKVCKVFCALRDAIEILTKLKMEKNFHKLENCSYIKRRKNRRNQENTKGFFFIFWNTGW
jgi:hypothetical protein